MSGWQKVSVGEVMEALLKLYAEVNEEDEDDD
jgi:hypothetical protein